MLQHLLVSLSKLEGGPAARSQWAGNLGPALVAAEAFLRSTGQQASALHCPNGCGCTHEVVSDAGRSVAVCVCEEGGGCEDIEATSEDLEVLEFNTVKFGRDIARALSLRTISETTNCPSTVQIGSWSAQAVPVFMNLYSNPARAHHTATVLTSQSCSPFILLVADATAWSARARPLLDGCGARVFQLIDLVRLTGHGTLLPLRNPAEVFAAFSAPAEPPGGEGGASAAFRLIEKLEASSPVQAPGLVTVFKHYCMDGLTAAQIAQKCRCSKTTVMDRLSRIRKVTGMAPASFRSYSGHLERTREQMADSRARRVERI